MRIFTATFLSDMHRHQRGWRTGIFFSSSGRLGQKLISISNVHCLPGSSSLPRDLPSRARWQYQLRWQKRVYFFALSSSRNLFEVGVRNGPLFQLLKGARWRFDRSQIRILLPGSYGTLIRQISCCGPEQGFKSALRSREELYNCTENISIPTSANLSCLQTSTWVRDRLWIFRPHKQA